MATDGAPPDVGHSKKIMSHCLRHLRISLQEVPAEEASHQMERGQTIRPHWEELQNSSHEPR